MNQRPRGNRQSRSPDYNTDFARGNRNSRRSRTAAIVVGIIGLSGFGAEILAGVVVSGSSHIDGIARPYIASGPANPSPDSTPTMLLPTMPLSPTTITTETTTSVAPSTTEATTTVRPTTTTAPERTTTTNAATQAASKLKCTVASRVDEQPTGPTDPNTGRQSEINATVHLTFSGGQYNVDPDSAEVVFSAPNYGQDPPYATNPQALHEATIDVPGPANDVRVLLRGVRGVGNMSCAGLITITPVG